MSQSPAAKTAAPDQPAPGLRVSLAGRTFHVADLAMVAFALAWLTFIMVSIRNAQLIASDDAFISFQYARNLARGLGLVFNPGERVWGFTSPLQTLVLGILTACGLETVRTAFFTGLLWVALACVLLYRLSLQFLPRTAALLLSLFFLLDRAQHGSYALESNLLTATQLAFLLAATTNKGAIANALAALSCLVRPDSLLLVAPVLLMGRETRRPRNLAWFVAIGLAWEGFALLYYRELVPNSYHAKLGLTHFAPFLRNALKTITGLTFSESLGFAREPSSIQRGIVFLLSLLPLLNRPLRRCSAVLYALALYPLLLVAAYSAIGSFPGHNWEFYSAQFFLRTSAIVGLLSLASVVAARYRMPLAPRRVAAIAALALVLTHGAIQAQALATNLTAKNTAYWSGARYATYRAIADWANHNIPRGSTVAISEVGTFAYYSDMHVIDVSGIVTRGYLPGERMNHARFMRRFAPSYAILYGNQTSASLGPTLRYDRLAYFPKQGFEDFSLLAKRPAWPR
jgi:hypothetical protein